jgi:hypothetical protein
MKKFLLLLSCCCILLLVSCQNKTKTYLVKKWDCVTVENLAPLDKNFITKEDSAVAIKMEAALKTLSWTFNSDNTYFCSTMGNKITVQGNYAIADDERTLTLTSLTKNTINTYTITSISDVEMTLTSTATTVPLVLHFSPN